MRWLAAAAPLVLAAGCADRPADHARYYPPEDRARSALEAALAGWRQGAPPGEVPGSAGPAVVFIDNHRPPNQRLAGYTVLGMAPGDGPRVFTVRLTLAPPAAEAKAKFVVVGIDPVWVFRQEDYDMLIHWSHPPAKKDDPAK